MKTTPIAPRNTLTGLASAVALAVATCSAFAQTNPVPAPQPGLFGQMVVFGDSLSDGGNFSLALGLPEISRFTTNPGGVAVENIANFLGLPLAPSLAGGSNYAMALANVLDNPPETPPFVTTLPQQLDSYLQAAGGRASPDALYTIVGGANDVFNNFLLASMGLLTPEQAQANLQAAAQADLGMITRLRDAGARYVMVFNLPDLGLSPDIAALGPEVAGQLTAMTVTFNDALGATLGNTGVNVVPVNLFGLYRELVADPARYGLANLTMPACGMDAVAIECGPQGSGAPYTYAPGTDNSYLFADVAHPTSGVHAMLAQYAESILLAPGQVSLLGVAPLASGDRLRRAIGNRVIANMSGAAGRAAQWWVGYSHDQRRLDAQVGTPGAHDRADMFTLGMDAQPLANLASGVAFTIDRQREHFDGNAGAFNLRELAATAYAGWDLQRAYLAADASYGRLDYDGIRRNIVIGPALRTEVADTAGTHLAVTLRGGYWFRSDAWRTGPFAELAWQRVRVDGFAEAGASATAMTFASQRIHSLIGTLGWQVFADLDAGNARLHPFARIAWHHDWRAEPSGVRAGLISMPGTFELPGFARDADWGSASVGLMARFSPRWSGWIAYERHFANSSERTNALSVGMNLQY